MMSKLADSQLPGSSQIVMRIDWSKCILCQKEILRCSADSKRRDVGTGKGYCVSTQKGRKPCRCANNISQEIVQFKFINSRSCGPSSEMNYKGQRRLLLYEHRIHEVVSEHAPMMR